MGILSPAWALLLLTSPARLSLRCHSPSHQNEEQGNVSAPTFGSWRARSPPTPTDPPRRLYACSCVHTQTRTRTCTHNLHTHAFTLTHTTYTLPTHTHTPSHIYTHSPHTWTTYDTHTENTHTHIHTTCTYTHICTSESSAFIRALLPGHPGGWELLA